MARNKYLKYALIGIMFLTALYFSCVAPIDPYQVANTSSQILLKNSKSQTDTLSITDSLGKQVFIGICRYLPKNIDSVRITVALKNNMSVLVLDTAIRFFTTSKPYDTLWEPITFTSAGEFQVKARSFASFSMGKIFLDSATIIIYNRIIPNNLPPKWKTDQIQMTVFSNTAISMNLSDSCSDPNNDRLTFSLAPGLSAKGTIVNGVYGYTPLAADTGMYAFKIIAADPSLATDTLAIALTVRPASMDTIRPAYKLVKPSKDSTSVNASTCEIDIIFTDAGAIASVRCFSSVDSFAVEHTDSLYSAIVTGLQPNIYTAITFSAIDGSSRANETRKTIYIKNDPLIQDSTGPILRRNQPSRDSVVTAVDSVSISISATDPSGVASVIAFLGTSPLVVAKADSLYSTVVKGLSSTAINRVSFIATDNSVNKNADTLTCFVKYNPTGNDHQKPTMALKTPATDSAKVSSASTTVAVLAKDASGIASVVCSMADSVFSVIATDSIYSATVKGLVSGQFNKIRFIATDASSNGNKETLFVSLKYDPTMADNTPPVFTKASGPASGSTVTAAAVAFDYGITDAGSGVDSVYWSLNGTRQGYMSASTADHYTLSATLVSPPHANKIVIYASDKSANHNRDSVVISLNYDLPPVATSRTDLTTPRAIALPCTLRAKDPESDALSGWAIIAGWPKHGTIAPATLAGPTLTYTPATTFEGMDTIKFTVSDGTAKSDTGLLVITMTENNIAPVIQTQPANASVNKGATAIFSVTVNSDAYPAPTYKWMKNNTEISGATSKSYTTPATAYTDDQSKFKVVITSGSSTVESNMATLTVLDVTVPTLTLAGAGTDPNNPLVMLLGATFAEPGLSASDDKDGDISGSVTVTGAPNASTPVGRYTVTYKVSDQAGNKATSKTRTVCVEGWEQVTSISTNTNTFRTALGLDSVLYLFLSPHMYKLTGTTLSQVGGTLPFNWGTIRTGWGGSELYYFTGQYGDPQTTGAQLYQLSGNTWQSKGTFLTWDAASPTIAFGPNGLILGTTDGIVVKQFSSTAWTTLGDGNVPNVSYESNHYFNDRFLDISSAGTPYLVGPGSGGGIACMKYSGGAWSGAANGDANVVSNSNTYQNVELAIYQNTVYVGGTQFGPEIYRLDGSTWTSLPSLGTGTTTGFGITASSDSHLYAAVCDGSQNMNVCRLNSSSQWENIPAVQGAPRKAFSASSCQGLTIEAGHNVCYVVYQQGSDQLIIWRWHKQ